MEIEVAEEIETEQATRGDVGWEPMGADGQLVTGNAEGLDRGYFEKGDIFDATRRRDGSALCGFGGIEADIEQDLWCEHRKRGAGVENHPHEVPTVRSLHRDVHENHRLDGIKCKGGHRNRPRDPLATHRSTRS